MTLYDKIITVVGWASLLALIVVVIGYAGIVMYLLITLVLGG